MQKSRIMVGLLATSLAAANVAWAQGDPQTLRQAESNAFQGGDNVHRAVPRQDNRRDSNRGNAYRGNDHRNDARYDGRGHQGPGAGPNHDFYRGGRLPPQYRSHQYVVDDWRGHHLSPPPRGYHWVQTGGDYVLAAIATGVITSIILNAAANR